MCAAADCAQEMGEQEPVLGALCCVSVGLSKKLHLSKFWAVTIILTCISVIPISLSMCKFLTNQTLQCPLR